MGISSVSSSALYRPATPSTDGALSGAASTPSAESSPGPGGFISPVIRYDQRARLAVLFFRDYDTGETRDQIPAKRVVEEYQRVAGNVNFTADDQAAGFGASGMAGGTPASSAASSKAEASSLPAGNSSLPTTAAPSASVSGAAAPSGAVVSLTV